MFSFRTTGSNPAECPLPGSSKLNKVALWHSFPYVTSHVAIALVFSVSVLFFLNRVAGSEFPDRECCDSVPPPPPQYHHATPTSTSTTRAPSRKFSTNTTGLEGQLNCIQAREQCRNDPSCRDYLPLVHKICGPELVACAAISPRKCQLLLRKIQAFSYMKNCGCYEPHIDFTCYTFRQQIFDHPCEYAEDVQEHEEMETCDEAYRKCRRNNSCLKHYLAFVDKCKSQNDVCIVEDREECYRSWQNVRRYSVFGCYCPNDPRMQGVVASSYGYPVTYDSRRRDIGGIKSLQNRNRKETARKCEDTFREMHYHPCLGPVDMSRATLIEKQQVLCHVALRTCENDPACRKPLDNFKRWCEHPHCEPDRCRNELQSFYEGVSIFHRLEVAFCVCRQNDAKGECLMAMRILHPRCAKKQAAGEPTNCSEVTRQCRKNKVCRSKLEEYERMCAADLTGRCVESHRSCQHAVINILGTELHASCVCKGTDFISKQDCHHWQRLLWANPCVIESHLALQEDLQNNEPDLEEIFTRRPTPGTTIMPTRAIIVTTENPYATGRIVNIPHQPTLNESSSFLNKNKPPFSMGMPRRPWGVSEDDKIQPTFDNTSVVEHPGGRFLPPPRGGIINLGNSGMPQRPFMNNRFKTPLPPVIGAPTRPSIVLEPSGQVPSRVSLWEKGHSKSNSPQGFERDTFFSNQKSFAGGGKNIEPIFFCNTTTGTGKQDGKLREVHITAGEKERFYTDDGCSEFCYCDPNLIKGPNGHTATCKLIDCIPSVPCKTNHATFPHNAPYIKAQRGNCICYSGKFICQRPEQEHYSGLSPGVYLFLGFSKGEMEALRKHTLKTELEALKEIESILIEKWGFECSLSVHKQVEENIIISVELKVPEDEFISPSQKQVREKACAEPLQILADQINERPRHHQVGSSAYLSMFILAEVHIFMPERHTHSGSQYICISGSQVMFPIFVIIAVHMLLRKV